MCTFSLQCEFLSLVLSFFLLLLLVVVVVSHAYSSSLFACWFQSMIEMSKGKGIPMVIDAVSNIF
jgi:hypothetical protein